MFVRNDSDILKYIWFQVNSSDSIKTIEKLASDEESMPELESVEFSSTTSMYKSYTKPKVVDEIEIYQDGLCVKQMDGEKIWFYRSYVLDRGIFKL